MHHNPPFAVRMPVNSMLFLEKEQLRTIFRNLGFAYLESCWGIVERGLHIHWGDMGSDACSAVKLYRMALSKL